MTMNSHSLPSMTLMDLTDGKRSNNCILKISITFLLRLKVKLAPVLWSVSVILFNRDSVILSDASFLSRMLELPSVSYIGQQQDLIDPKSIYQARQLLLSQIKRVHRDGLDKLYSLTAPCEEYALMSPQSMGLRALQNTTLSLLSSTHGRGCARRAKTHYDDAKTMTDRIGSSKCFNTYPILRTRRSLC